MQHWSSSLKEMNEKKKRKIRVRKLLRQKVQRTHFALQAFRWLD